MKTHANSLEHLDLRLDVTGEGEERRVLMRMSDDDGYNWVEKECVDDFLLKMGP